MYKVPGEENRNNFPTLSPTNLSFKKARIYDITVAIDTESLNIISEFVN